MTLTPIKYGMQNNVATFTFTDATLSLHPYPGDTDGFWYVGQVALSKGNSDGISAALNITPDPIDPRHLGFHQVSNGASLEELMAYLIGAVMAAKGVNANVIAGVKEVQMPDGDYLSFQRMMGYAEHLSRALCAWPHQP